MFYVSIVWIRVRLGSLTRHPARLHGCIVYHALHALVGRQMYGCLAMVSLIQYVTLPVEKVVGLTRLVTAGAQTVLLWTVTGVLGRCCFLHARLIMTGFVGSVPSLVGPGSM